MNPLLTKRWKLSNNQKGMTLIELMAVVVILGILAAAAGAAVSGGFTTSRANTDITTQSVLEDAVQRFHMENPATPLGTVITAAQLRNGGYIKAIPEWSTGAAIISVTVTNAAATGLTFTFDPVRPAN